MKEKILLVSIHIEESARAVPLGAAMVASNICKKLKNFNVRLIDLYLTDSFEESLSKIDNENADIVGFSTYLWNRDRILELASELKKRSEARIILGGPEATADKVNLLDFPYIDDVVEGEGERKILSLLGGENEEASEIKDLNNLPSPYLDGTINISERNGVLWELSRGCPFKCDFCFESKGSDLVRNFSKERIEKELKLFKDNGITEIFVLDPTFNYNKKRAVELLNLIIETAPDIHYTIEIRAEYIDEELAYLFSQINCSLQIGLQSSEPSVLEKINRKMDKELFADKILLLHEHGVIYGFDLIYGLPGDSYEGFLSSLDYAISLVPNHMDIFPLSVLPGTRLYDTAEKLGLKWNLENPYNVLESGGFKKGDMERARVIAEAFDLFYNRGKAVPWFISVTEALEFLPSELISEFSQFIRITGYKNDNKDIFGIIASFLRKLFKSRGMEKEGQVASDLVLYFGYTAALMEEKSDYIPETDLYLNPDSYTLKFFHDYEKLLYLISDGITSLKDLSQILDVDPSYMIFYVDDENSEVKERDLTREEYLFLNGVDFDQNEQFLNRFIEEKIIRRRK